MNWKRCWVCWKLLINSMNLLKSDSKMNEKRTANILPRQHRLHIVDWKITVIETIVHTRTQARIMAKLTLHRRKLSSFTLPILILKILSCRNHPFFFIHPHIYVNKRNELIECYNIQSIFISNYNKTKREFNCYTMSFV